MRRRVAAVTRLSASTQAGEQRLVLVIGAVVFLDTMFYAVIAPLLPDLAHELALSKLSAGVLTASYPLGTLVASVPGGLLAVRAGPRFTVCTGLALLAGSTIAFAFLQEAAALDAARFVEGVGGACSWAGGVAWIVAETESDRRGAVMGRVLGTAIGGALFGPVIGTIATATGRPATFAAVAVAAGALLVRTRALPSQHVASRQGLRTVGAALRSPGVAAGMWLMTLPAIGAGLINVLGPLRLNALGAPAAVVGAIYLVATAFEAAIAPVVGSLSDRRGRLAPLRFSLGAATAALLCFTLPDAVVPEAAVIVVIVAALGVFWAPAMAMLSEAGEGHGLDQGLAAALMNLAWAGGQIIGSGGGGAVAKTDGDGVPVAIIAAVLSTTLLISAVWSKLPSARRGRGSRH